MSDYTHAVRDALGGHDEKPPKKISHIEHRKSHNGDHIFTHHHDRPDHHPPETHTKRGDDEMVEHMLQHAGTPNPGEAEADAGNPESYSGAGDAAAAPAAPADSANANPGAVAAPAQAMGA